MLRRLTPPSPFGLLPLPGGGDQHGAARGPEAPVSQDQNGGREHDPGRGHSPHPQRGVHGLPVPQHHRGRLENRERERESGREAGVQLSLPFTEGLTTSQLQLRRPALQTVSIFHNLLRLILIIQKP